MAICTPHIQYTALKFIVFLILSSGWNIRSNLNITLACSLSPQLDPDPLDWRTLQPVETIRSVHKYQRQNIKHHTVIFGVISFRFLTLLSPRFTLSFHHNPHISIGSAIRRRFNYTRCAVYLCGVQFSFLLQIDCLACHWVCYHSVALWLVKQLLLSLVSAICFFFFKLLA